jgi:endonuclease G, mitochondrial
MPAPTPGCDKKFLDVLLPLPSVLKKDCAPVTGTRGIEIRYTHYSSFLHKERMLPLMTAVNIKGEGYHAPTRAGNEPWDFSEQVPEKFQLDNSFYRNDGNTFDRGHLVRRVDPCWGDDDDVVDQAEIETFRWTNCTPQHKKLNQRGGVWFELEQHVMEHGVKNKIANISVFAGPVLNNDDQAMLVKKGKYKNKFIRIPVEFWKVIVWKKNDGKLYAVGFLMSQWEFIKNKVQPVPVERARPLRAPKPKLADDYFENLKFADHKTYQVSIATIEKKTGISFNWHNVKFPFKARTAKVIRATPVKHAYPFVAIYYKTKRMRKADKKLLSKAAIKRSIQRQEAPLSKAQVSRAVKSGYAGAINRWSLKNVTL